MSKRELIRVVRLPEHVQVDLTGKLAGRGAYLHNKRSCWERALKGSLAHALKVNLTEEDLRHLEEFLQELPDEPDDDSANGKIDM